MNNNHPFYSKEFSGEDTPGTLSAFDLDGHLKWQAPASVRGDGGRRLQRRIVKKNQPKIPNSSEMTFLTFFWLGNCESFEQCSVGHQGYDPIIELGISHLRPRKSG